MSGGHFDYDQYKLGDISDSIKDVIFYNNDESLNEWGDKKGRGYSEETIQRFKDAVFYLELAQIYAQRIDWLLSGDDGEETFHKRLDDEICKLGDETWKDHHEN